MMPNCDAIYVVSFPELRKEAQLQSKVGQNEATGVMLSTLKEFLGRRLALSAICSLQLCA